MSDAFNFDEFMRNVSNVDPDTKREMLRDEVSDVMDATMLEVAPRLWCVLQDVCNQNPTSAVHLNAVLNSAIFSILAWCAAVTPKGETDERDNDEVLREKIIANLEQALAGRSEQNRAEIASMAMNVGRLKLAMDVSKDLGKLLMHNSMVVQACVQALNRHSPDPS